MIYRLSVLTFLCMLAFPAAAVDVPPEFERFILDAKENRKSWLQMLCETYDICEKSRANRSLAMVIGVSKYAHLRDLETTGNDAQQLASFLLESGEFDQVVLLRESDATKERINWFMEDYFPALLKEESNSRFLFYFSGHGKYTEATGRGYLRLADNRRNQNYRSIGMDTVATWAKRNTKNAIHSLFLVDACVSGIAGLETMGDDDKSGFPARDPSELIEERAGWLLTAGKGRQKAWAHEDWGGSLFNYALMQGLQRGKADRRDSDGIITSLELYDYIDAVVRSETPAGKKQTPQRWRFRPGSGDFFFKSPETRGVVPGERRMVDAQDMGGGSRRIHALLRECQAHFDANRLTTGRGGNAADCYEEVLKLDRGNPKALEGLTAIEDRYRGWAEKALKQGRLERAKGYIAKIELFNPEGDAVFELKEQLRKAERGEYIPNTKSVSPAPASTKIGNPTPAFWQVQVASFSRRENAKKLINRLKESGMPAQLKEIEINGKRHYRVQMSPQQDKNQAVKLAKRIKKEFALHSSVVHY
ncbi:MAG: caspase family protein [Pseudomonadota bacterium]